MADTEAGEAGEDEGKMMEAPPQEVKAGNDGFIPSSEDMVDLMLQAKNDRKRAESDVQLLANRLAHLKVRTGGASCGQRRSNVAHGDGSQTFDEGPQRRRGQRKRSRRKLRSRARRPFAGGGGYGKRPTFCPLPLPTS